jgi:hypothetical protein
MASGTAPFGPKSADGHIRLGTSESKVASEVWTIFRSRGFSGWFDGDGRCPIRRNLCRSGGRVSAGIRARSGFCSASGTFSMNATVGPSDRSAILGFRSPACSYPNPWPAALDAGFENAPRSRRRPCRGAKPRRGRPGTDRHGRPHSLWRSSPTCCATPHPRASHLAARRSAAPTRELAIQIPRCRAPGAIRT